MAGTLRFQALVDRSGRPDVYTPWSDPSKDPAFQKARKLNRVLTIHQNLRGAKDFGEVGFQQGRGLQFLIFPKSLSWADGKRVVGIRYEDIAEAKFPARAPAAKTTKQRKAKTTGQETPPKSETQPTEKPVPPERAAPPEETSVRVVEAKPEEPVKLDPLTEQLKTVLGALEKKHVTKAKSVLKTLIEERERA